MKRVLLAAALLCAPASFAVAQDGASADPSAAPAPAAPSFRIPAGVTVHVEIVDPLSSRTSQRGDTFALRLVEPILVNNEVAVPAGAAGGGEVIDAQRSGIGGRQGQLILAGRFLEINGERVRLRGMQILGNGEDRSATSTGVSMIPYVGVVGVFIQGGEIEFQHGVRATARLATEVIVPQAPAALAEAEPNVEGETP